MLTKIKLGFGALSMVLVVGCGGQASGPAGATQQNVSSAKADSADGQSDSPLSACNTDDDCIAVPQADCCPNGTLAAVNQDQVEAYYDAHVCNNPPAFCPHYMVDDTRVAQCDIPNHQCHMIDPAQIRCGGFIAPAMQHQCPTGFECHFAGVPDLPGNCVASSSASSN